VNNICVLRVREQKTKAGSGYRQRLF